MQHSQNDNSVRKRYSNMDTAEDKINSPIKDKSICSKSKYKTLKITYAKNKIHFLWIPLYLAIWGLLYYFIVLYASKNLPTPLTVKDSVNNSDSFIEEYAVRNLQLLTKIGPRVVGSAANEQAAVQFLRERIEDIQNHGTTDVNSIELDIQQASGGYVLANMVNLYQAIQNVVVKLSPKNRITNSSLLINSHFDTVPGSPGAGDDGTMVVVMLEVLRVLAKSQTPLQHSVVFLFNGAEENPLQASHAFITSHKWAKDIKAFINMDSAGNGGREILFQHGPGHPWLMKYYQSAIKHPFASTLAEELFQNNFIPSDTDFRIFRDYGKIPGLDFAHSTNGYVYHTSNDKINNVNMGTLQHTGDNILEITKAIANCEELENPDEHAEGHTVFFDFLGLFIITYSELVALITNIVVCVFALILISLSIWVIKDNSGFFLRRILSRFAIIFIIQSLSVCFAGLIAFGLAFALDFFDATMSWFYNTWMVLGIYFSSIFFGLGVLPVVYLALTKENGLAINYRVQLFLHSQCILMIIVTLVGTGFNIRSSFLFMISVLFYSVSLLINLITTLHNRSYSWILPVIIGQIVPFLFYSYVAYLVFSTFIPMTGRSGSQKNPELLICIASCLFGILIGGYLVPLLCIFRRSKIIIILLLLNSIAFIILIFTPIGFPFREDVATQRFWIFHTQRTFYDYDRVPRKNESGYYLLPMDRLTPTYISKNIPNAITVTEDCKNELKCGLPLYYFRMDEVKDSSYWVPGPPPKPIQYKLHLRRMDYMTSDKLRYEFSLAGQDHMSLFIEPSEDCELVNWSFLPSNESLARLSSPYFIYFSYGTDARPLNFYLDFNKNSSRLTEKQHCFDIAAVAHRTHHNIHRTNDFNKFIGNFPPWSYVTAFMSAYESFKF